MARQGYFINCVYFPSFMHLIKHWIAFCRCLRAIWIASERKANCMKICFSFRCNSHGPWTPTKWDSILIFTSFYNKVCRGIVYLDTKMSYLSYFKRTKSKTLRTVSTGRMTNWKKSPCDPVQIIQAKDWYF